jgi:hypothetical protein
MSKFVVEARCSAGHVQRLTYEGFDREYVEAMCRLLDGTSTLYKYPPDDKSPIGKCRTCGLWFTAKIVEEVPDA